MSKRHKIPYIAKEDLPKEFARSTHGVLCFRSIKDSNKAYLFNWTVRSECYKFGLAFPRKNEIAIVDIYDQEGYQLNDPAYNSYDAPIKTGWDYEFAPNLEWYYKGDHKRSLQRLIRDIKAEIKLSPKKAKKYIKSMGLEDCDLNNYGIIATVDIKLQRYNHSNSKYVFLCDDDKCPCHGFTYVDTDKLLKIMGEGFVSPEAKVFTEEWE